MKEILQYFCTWKFWKELFIMTLGMAIAAAAVYYFMMPGKLVLGSISGLWGPSPVFPSSSPTCS